MRKNQQIILITLGILIVSVHSLKIIDHEGLQNHLLNLITADINTHAHKKIFQIN